jgi:hypothetical protein
MRIYEKMEERKISNVELKKTKRKREIDIEEENNSEEIELQFNYNEKRIYKSLCGNKL